MNDAERRELDRLRAAVLDLQRGMKGIPARFGPPLRTTAYLQVIDGNELIAGVADGLKGIAAASGIEYVPTASPSSGTTYVDGLSSALDLDTSGTLVWIASACKIGSTTYQDLVGDLIEGTPVHCVRSVSLPIGSTAGTTFATVYIPYRA